MKSNPYSSPRPPFIEFNSYFAEHNANEALSDLVAWLDRRGSVLLDGDTCPYRSIDEIADPNVDGPFRELSASDCRELLATSERSESLLELRYGGVLSNEPSRVGRVRVLPLKEPALIRDRHPVAIWCDGMSFEHFVSAHIRTQAEQAAHEFFHDLCDALDPSYASITMEGGMPSPHELAQDPRLWDANSFYLSNSFVGPGVVKRVAAASSRGTVTARGILVVEASVFGPNEPTESSLLAVRGICELTY